MYVRRNTASQVTNMPFLTSEDLFLLRNFTRKLLSHIYPFCSSKRIVNLKMSAPRKATYFLYQRSYGRRSMQVIILCNHVAC